MDHYSNILLALETARAGGLAWYELTETIRRLELSGQNDFNGRSWVKVASERSGYTVNQIRQMQRTLFTLEQLLSRDKGLKRQTVLNSFSYSYLEIVARIAKISAENALKNLRSALIADRHPTYRQIRDEYYALRAHLPQTSPIAAGLRASHIFEKMCGVLLKGDNAERLYRPAFGVDETRRATAWPGGFRYAKPSVMIECVTRRGGQAFDAAAAFALYGEVPQEEAIRRLRRAAFDASFFRFYWILLPTGSAAEFFARERDILKLCNIGVVQIDQKNSDIREIYAPHGPPVPDRREIFFEFTSRAVS